MGATAPLSGSAFGCSLPVGTLCGGAAGEQSLGGALVPCPCPCPWSGPRACHSPVATLLERPPPHRRSCSLAKAPNPPARANRRPGSKFLEKGKRGLAEKKKIPGSPTPSGSCQGCRSCRPITGQACLVAVKAPTRAPIGPARGGVVPWSGKDLGEPSLCRPTGQMREHETLALCPLSAKRAAKSKWECPSTTTPHNTPQCPSATADLSLGCSPELPSEVERNTSGAGRPSRRETRRLLGRPGPPPPWLPLGPVASPKARVQLPPSSTTSPKILPWERQGWGLAR